MDPTLHNKMKVMKPMMDLVKGLQTRRDHEKTRAQKETGVNVDREHRDGCAGCVKPMNGGQV